MLVTRTMGERASAAYDSPMTIVERARALWPSSISVASAKRNGDTVTITSRPLLPEYPARLRLVVREGQTAIVLTLGRVARADVGPGLHFKVPLIESARIFDRRLQVLDADPEANNRDKTMVVKLVASHQPVPPENKSGLPFVPVRLSGLTLTPWVDDNGPRPKLAWSIRATGLEDVTTAAGKAA